MHISLQFGDQSNISSGYKKGNLIAVFLNRCLDTTCDRGYGNTSEASISLI
jgi:hypothetical protein